MNGAAGMISGTARRRFSCSASLSSSGIRLGYLTVRSSFCRSVSGGSVRWKIDDTPEQAEFRDGLRVWIRGVLPEAWVAGVESGDDDACAAARRQAEKEGWNPFLFTAQLGASGYAAPLWPAEYGGMSAESWAVRVVREELERYRLPTVSANILGLGLAGPTLIEHGTDEQKERYLRKVLTGEEIWCQ